MVDRQFKKKSEVEPQKLENPALSNTIPKNTVTISSSADASAFVPVLVSPQARIAAGKAPTQDTWRRLSATGQVTREEWIWLENEARKISALEKRIVYPIEMRSGSIDADSALVQCYISTIAYIFFNGSNLHKNPDWIAYLADLGIDPAIAGTIFLKMLAAAGSGLATKGPIGAIAGAILSFGKSVYDVTEDQRKRDERRRRLNALLTKRWEGIFRVCGPPPMRLVHALVKVADDNGFQIRDSVSLTQAWWIWYQILKNQDLSLFFNADASMVQKIVHAVVGKERAFDDGRLRLFLDGKWVVPPSQITLPGVGIITTKRAYRTRSVIDFCGQWQSDGFVTSSIYDTGVGLAGAGPERNKSAMIRSKIMSDKTKNPSAPNWQFFNSSTGDTTKIEVPTGLQSWLFSTRVRVKK